MKPLIDFFGIKDLIPHGYCLSWSPVLLWLNVTSDLLITLAYYSIPLMLVYFIRQRKDLPYPGLVVMFAGFIVACGTTHLLSAITIWIPLYWLDGMLKGFTAIISIATAMLMLWVIPRALSLPSAAQLQAEIQHRKTAEEALRESENKLATILDSVEACIYIKDCNYQYQYANQAVRQLFGKALEDIIDEIDDVFFDEDTTAKLHENDRRVIELGERIETENIYNLKDNATPRTYLTVKQPLRNEDSSIYGLCGISTDISERKLAEQALRQSQTELQEAQRIAHVGNWLLDVATHHIVWSEEFYRIFGLNPQLPPPNYTEHHRLFTPESWERLNTTLLHTQQTGEPYELELEIVRADGAQGWILARGEAIRNESGATVGFHGVALDITERKLAERVLIQLKAMIDISLDGFWIVDLMGNLLQVNDAYARMSGYSIDELMNMSISQLEATEDSIQITAHIEKVVAQGYDLFETRHRHKDGHILDVEISVAFLPEFQHFCAFCRNITERKVMENELKASETKFRSIIEVSPVPMALLDDEHLNLTFLNPAFVQTFGYNLDDIPTLADWWPKAYPDPDYRHWVEASWQMAMEKAKQEQTDIQPLELVIRCKNNNIKTVIVSAADIHNSAGMHLVILYDITKLKQIEAKLNSIFNASVEGIITIDMSDIIVSVNAAVETIFGYKPEELMGCSFNKLIPSSPKEMNDCSLPHTVKFDGQIREIEGIHKNGSAVPLDLSIAEYSIDNAHYFTYIVRDVSLRKHREQQDKKHLDELAHVTRLGLMGEMASGIAHEVNQPLSAISSYTQVSLNLMNTENPDLVKLTEILYKTKQQALRAGRIIHRMREFVKSQSKHRTTADINTLIHDAVSLCSAELKHNDIKLTFELESNLPPIYVDHIHIEQVIINLIRNSVDALQNLPAKQHRQITIHSRLTLNNAIQVRVKDNGPGLNEEQQQKILTPFYTSKTDGMGMGLSISRSLIEAHEGTLRFNSKAGKGSSFYFTIPVKQNGIMIS